MADQKADLIGEIWDLQQKTRWAMQQTNQEAWKSLGVPIAQLKSLYFIINKGNTNFSGLAQDLGVTPANMTAIIERLVDQGLVSRIPSRQDRRVVLLQATDEGRSLLSSLMESGRSQMMEIMGAMSLEDLTFLSKGLNGLTRAVEEYNQRARNETLRNFVPGPDAL